MKRTQYATLYILIGVAILAAIGLNYVLLAPHLRTGFSPAGWAIFSVVVALGIAALAPILLLRRRGLRVPLPVSAADRGFMAGVTVAGCALAVFGVFSGMLWIMALGIMLAPIALSIRRPRVQ